MKMQDLIGDVEKLIKEKEHLLEQCESDIKVASFPEGFVIDSRIESLEVYIRELKLILNKLENLD